MSRCLAAKTNNRENGFSEASMRTCFEKVLPISETRFGGACEGIRTLVKMIEADSFGNPHSDPQCPKTQLTSVSCRFKVIAAKGTSKSAATAHVAFGRKQGKLGSADRFSQALRIFVPHGNVGRIALLLDAMRILPSESFAPDSFPAPPAETNVARSAFIEPFSHEQNVSSKSRRAFLFIQPRASLRQKAPIYIEKKGCSSVGSELNLDSRS
jgi:hypothetical protein